MISLLLLALISGCGAFARPGAACTQHDQCKGLKDGYCSLAEICTAECNQTNPCPDGSQCVPQLIRSVCLPTCETSDECLKNFTCRSGTCQLSDPLEPPP